MESAELSDNTSIVSDISIIHKQSHKQDSTFSWVICSIGFLLFFSGGGFLSATGIFINSMATSLSLSTAFLSVMFSSTFSFTLMFGLITGILIDLFGYRKIMAAGGLITFVALFTTAWCTKVWQMVFSFSILLGLGLSFTVIPVLSLINQYFREYQTTACGIAVSGWGIGTLVFGALNDWMLYPFTWSVVFIIWSIVIGGGIVAGAIVCERRTTDNYKRGSFRKTLKPFVQSWHFRKLFLATLFIGVGILIPWLHLVPYAESVDIPRQQALYIISMLGISNGIGRIILGVLPKKVSWFTPIRTLRISFFVIGVTTPLWYFCTEVWSLMIYGGVYGFFAGSMVSMLPPVLAIYFPSEICAGTIVGMISTAAGIGSGLGIAMSTLLVYYFGDFLAMMCVSSAFILLGFLIFCTVSSTVPFWAAENFESDGIETIFTSIWEEDSFSQHGKLQNGWTNYRRSSHFAR